MIAVLADHNIEGQAALLWSTMLTSGWLEFDLFRLVTFSEIGLSVGSTDRVVWRFVQAHGMLLLTGNRNITIKSNKKGQANNTYLLKHEFPPELDWFTDIQVGIDLGYQGIQSDYCGEQIAIPTKKPRKSKKNPDPQLTDEQKAANKALSQVRIFIEHAIGGMKRYNILVHVFRNRKADFEDDAVGICAGLWNFTLSY